MNDKARLDDAQPNDDDALLAQHGFSYLPVTFAMREEDGTIIQEKAACYRCAADGFYGLGTSGTWWMEGAIIVTDIVPNIHMQPLNRAAGLLFAQWQKRLPTNRVAFDMGDMAEASQMLAKNPKVQELNPVEYQAALIKMCEELKLRREGKDARSLPGIGHNFTPQSGGKAPPILGAKMSDMTQRGPGFTQAAAAVPANHQGGVRRGTSTLGGEPPR